MIFNLKKRASEKLVYFCSGNLPLGRLEYKLLSNAITTSEAAILNTVKVMNEPKRKTELVQMCITLNRSLCHSNSNTWHPNLYCIGATEIQWGKKIQSYTQNIFYFIQSETRCWDLPLSFLMQAQVRSWSWKQVNQIEFTPGSVQSSCQSCHFLWPWKGKLHLSCLRWVLVWSMSLLQVSVRGSMLRDN